MGERGTGRVVVERVEPEVDCGRFPAKRVVGDLVEVRADAFADGHDRVAARLLFLAPGDDAWRSAPMRPLGNDRWAAAFRAEALGVHRFTVEAWVDHFGSWQEALARRVEAGQAAQVDLLVGAALVESAAARAAARGAAADEARLLVFARAIRDGAGMQSAIAAGLDPALRALSDRHPDLRLATRYEPELAVVVDPERARFSAWYERFPRSAAPAPGRHGTLEDLARLLPEIARMGFDIVYLPPIHPIGRTNRKGRNNTTDARPGDPGSPWAIGAAEGGHTAVHPDLGTVDDVRRLAERARGFDLDLALDLALQCSPDHPWVREHPAWFRWRPDGAIQHAENPPKRYEDIVPLDFEADDSRALWEALLGVVRFWVGLGVRVFRVDNPHTKPFAFWEWLIAAVKRDHPEVFFLSEAFTRPKVMYRLAKVGFSQSYTYFTWRTTRAELTQYLAELTRPSVREFFRPSFWPNTPDILPEHLQIGGRAAFVARLVLAATLSPSYGIYGPPFELCVADALPGREEYRDSEKYEIRHWDWNAPGHLRDLLARLNAIRRENRALQGMEGLEFHEVDNERIICYSKGTPDGTNLVLVAVNLDAAHAQGGWVRLPLDRLGIGATEPFLVDDLLGDRKQIWQGERNYLRLDPAELPAAVFRVHRRLRRETDFDYYL